MVTSQGKKIAVVLSGCGFLDGSEVTEAISVLIALHQAGATPSCFAPSIEAPGMNHLSGEPLPNPRNVLEESARIARREVKDLRELDAHQFDAVIFPGGYGAAKNLSTWGFAGAKGKVHPEVERVLKDFRRSDKPIGAICIAPALLALLFGSDGITITIGNDPTTAAEIEKTGAHHEICPVNDYVTDREHKIVTTPAYMYESRPDLVFQGISGLVRELVEMS